MSSCQFGYNYFISCTIIGFIELSFIFVLVPFFLLYLVGTVLVINTSLLVQQQK